MAPPPLAEPFLILKVGAGEYAVNAGLVRQMIAVPQLSPLAGEHRAWLSMLSLGSLRIPVIDLRRRLAETSDASSYRIGAVAVVEWKPGVLVGVEVDKFCEIMHLSPAAIHGAPRRRSTLPPLVRATTRRKGRTCYLLDLDNLFAFLAEQIVPLELKSV
jgi:chemotaxis signal transduction protein